MNIGLYDFKTPWGVPLKGYAREDTCDRNTLISCIDEDEYRVAKLPENGVAIDIGSYIAGCSLALASKGYQVYSIDPIPENNKLAQENITINGYDSKIKIYEAAVTSQPNKSISAFYGDTNTEIGRVHEFIGRTIPYAEFIPDRKDGRIISVPTITLEQIFEENKIERCNFLKVDIEGGEWEIFENISEKLLDKIDRIAIEMDAKRDTPTSTTEFLKLLKDKFMDYSPTYFPDWCAPGTWVHGYYINKKI